MKTGRISLALATGLSAGLFVGLAGAAGAFPCRFTTECYEAEPCIDTRFDIDVRIDDEAIITDYDRLIIVAVKRRPGLITLFATGKGAEYLLSITPRAARFSVQNNEGPEAITYLGRCEGAF